MNWEIFEDDTWGLVSCSSWAQTDLKTFLASLPTAKVLILDWGPRKRKRK